MKPLLAGCSLCLAVVALLASGSARADEPRPQKPGVGVMDVHYALGTVALGSFATALVIGSASGNLGKLMDAERCCPDGGDRNQTWRTVDRALVNVGIVTYSASAALAGYSLLFRAPPPDAPQRHAAHRWLALGHGAAFITSAVTGIIMARSQSTDPDRFAAAARIHVASNVALVPLLTMAFSGVVFD